MSIFQRSIDRRLFKCSTIGSFSKSTHRPDYGNVFINENECLLDVVHMCDRCIHTHIHIRLLCKNDTNNSQSMQKHKVKYCHNVQMSQCDCSKEHCKRWYGKRPYSSFFSVIPSKSTFSRVVRWTYSLFPGLPVSFYMSINSNEKKTCKWANWYNTNHTSIFMRWPIYLWYGLWRSNPWTPNRKESRENPSEQHSI